MIRTSPDPAYAFDTRHAVPAPRHAGGCRGRDGRPAGRPPRSRARLCRDAVVVMSDYGTSLTPARRGRMRITDTQPSTRCCAWPSCSSKHPARGGPSVRDDSVPEPRRRSRRSSTCSTARRRLGVRRPLALRRQRRHVAPVSTTSGRCSRSSRPTGPGVPARRGLDGPGGGRRARRPRGSEVADASARPPEHTPGERAPRPR